MDQKFTVRYVLRDDWRRISGNEQLGFEGAPDNTTSLTAEKPFLRSREFLSRCIRTFDRPLRFSGPTSDESEESTDYSTERYERFGLYVPSRGYWLDGERSLGEFQLLPCTEKCDKQQRHICDVIELQDRQNFVSDASSYAHYAEGAMEKKGDRSIIWRERYFILRNRRLSYYKTSKDAHQDRNVIGWIDLHPKKFEITTIQQRENDDSFYFQVILTKEYRFKVKRRADGLNWARILCNLRLSNSKENGGNFFNDCRASMPRSDSLSASSCSDTSGTFDEESVNENTLSLEKVHSVFHHMNLSEAVKTQYHESPSSFNSSSIDIKGDKVGFLYKKGNYNRSLKRRLFVLRDKILYYYKFSNKKNDSGLTLLQSKYHFAGLINLEGCRIYLDSKGGRKSFIFRIVAPSRSYLVSTDNMEEYQDWKDAFEFICGIELKDMVTIAGAHVENPRYVSIAIGMDLCHSLPGDCNTMDSISYSSDDEFCDKNSGKKSAKPHKMKLILDFDHIGRPEMEGILLKQGNDRLGNWKERYAVLAGRTLFYCTEGKKTEPIGSIPLAICHIENINCTSLSFDIEMKNVDLVDPIIRIYHFQTKKRSELEDWLRVLSIHTQKSF